MATPIQKTSFLNDLFISYSRKDIVFARALEKALENYAPPKDLNVPDRRLVVFRDEDDFIGVEYNQSLRNHLKNSNKMLVICSPDARASQFVNEEIRLFADMRGAKNIIPVLLSGIPNSEATTPEDEHKKAFPRSLIEEMPMPLAASFLDIDPKRTKPHKGQYTGSWYAILANLYGVSRSEIEQRERKRKIRQLRIRLALGVSIIVVLSVALIVALIERDNAIKAQLETQNQLKKNYWANAIDSKERGDWLGLLHYAAKAGAIATEQPFFKNTIFTIQNHINAYLNAIMKHDDSISGSAVKRNLILTWSQDDTARLWKAYDGKAIGQPMIHKAMEY